MSGGRASGWGVVVLVGLVVAVGCRQNPETAKLRYYENGNRFFAEKRYADAIVEYRNAVKQDASFGEARYRLGEAYAHENRLREAFGEYVRAADVLPNNVDVQLKAGALLLIAGQFEDARTRADRALALDVGNVQAQILRANAIAGLKDLDGAVREIEEAIQLDPQQSTTYSNLGALELARGQNIQAEAAFKKAVETDPNSATAHLGLANFYWATGRRRDAEASMLRANKLDPANALASRALAAFYITSGQPERAEPYFQAIVQHATDGGPRVALADYYLVMKRPGDALQLLREATTDDQFFVDAKARIAAIEYGEGQREQAHRTIEEAIARRPESPVALLMKARFLLAEQKVEEALARAKAAVAVDPRSAMAQYTLGTIYASTNALDEAVKAFNEVLRLNPRAVPAQLQLARLELRKGRAETSVQLAEDAVSTDPENPVARLFLARGLMVQGDLRRAEVETRVVLDKFPNAAVVHAQLGTLALLRRDTGTARRSFDRALELDPNSLEALTGLVTIDLATKRPTEARARVESKLAQTPGSGALMLLAARTYASDGDLVKAEQTLRRAIEQDASNLSAYGLLGQLYLAQRKLDAAVGEFETLATKQPNSVPALTMVAMIKEAQGRGTEARERYERIMQIDSRAAVAANNLAWMYAEQGDNLDVALQLAQTAKLQLPDQAEVNDTLGWVYLKKGLPALAIPPLEQSVEKDPQNPMYRFRLGVAYARAGDKTAARRELERALTLKTDFPGADEARQILASI